MNWRSLTYTVQYNFPSKPLCCYCGNETKLYEESLMSCYYKCDCEGAQKELELSRQLEEHKKNAPALKSLEERQLQNEIDERMKKLEELRRNNADKES